VVAVGCLRVWAHQQQAEVAVRYRGRMAGHRPGRVLPRHADGTVADVAAQVCPIGAIIGALKEGEGGGCTPWQCQAKGIGNGWAQQALYSCARQ